MIKKWKFLEVGQSSVGFFIKARNGSPTSKKQFLKMFLSTVVKKIMSLIFSKKSHQPLFYGW